MVLLGPKFGLPKVWIRPNFGIPKVWMNPSFGLPKTLNLYTQNRLLGVYMSLPITRRHTGADTCITSQTQTYCRLTQAHHIMPCETFSNPFLTIYHLLHFDREDPPNQLPHPSGVHPSETISFLTFDCSVVLVFSLGVCTL